MAGTLALTMFVTPLSTISVVSAAEMETADTEVLAETSAEDTEEEDTAETEKTEEAEADQPEVMDAPECDTAEGDILLDEEHFPDAKFRSYLSRNVDKNGDSILSKAERDARTMIKIDNVGASDLTGIEYFTELTYLSCCGNRLTTLDVSANTKLRNLHCYSNRLTNLDVRANTELIYFSCHSNSLTKLDVSANTKLTSLSCYSNSLTNLDVSANTELVELDCASNSLTKLDVSANTKLTTLYCTSNSLMNLDVRANMKLTTLYCTSNSLTNLDVRANTELEALGCDSNSLTKLDMSTNTKLKYLYCSSNSLTKLDMSTNTNLRELECHSNKLTSLDVSGATNLTTLKCHSNKLTSLDVSGATNLRELECYSNNLVSLNVNANLYKLYCKSNALTSLDVSGATYLSELNCLDNSLSDLTTNARLEYLYCGNNELTSLDVSANTELLELYCNNNNLTSLNVSEATKLKKLYCNDNQLTSLDVSANTALEDLYCNDNQLTSLDVSANTALEDLHCNDNQLTSLDVSANTALEEIDFNCNNNIYYAKLDAGRKYALSKLSGFDYTKVSDVTGGTFSDTELTFNEGSDTVTYTYDCGNSMSAAFTIREKVMITSVTLDKTVETVLKGETLQLTATVAPEEASIQNVAWTTSDSNVATVSNSGKVTAKAVGTATITCTAKDGSGVSATCVVTVKSLVTKVTLNKTTANIFKGKTLQLRATITPSDATNKSVTWKSSNTKVATVSSSGKVTAKAVGTATITCTAKDGSGVKETCQITVTNPVTKITLNKTQTGLSPKETLQLKATVSPSNASNKSVTWKSSNTKVATVTSSGKVTAKKAGTATITCTAKDGSGVKATCKITVYTNTEAFCSRLYTLCMGRSVDQAGMDYWTAQLDNGSQTGASVGYNFVFSTEYIGKNTSDEAFVKMLYEVFMNRSADQGGLNYWVDLLQQGVSREYVYKEFAESQEYTDICNSYGIVRGSVKLKQARDYNVNMTKYVSRIYEKALNRKGDADGLNYWCGQMQTKAKTPVQVAESFFLAPEFTNKNLSDTEYVKVLYRTFMGREYDQGGLDYWLSRLAKGESRKSVLESFAGCQEFKDIVKSFGL